MVDVHSKEIRSKNMSAIKSKNTKAELTVFRYLRSQNTYFQKHYAKVIGKPDIALPRKKKAVFIDGDFWHGRSLDRVVSVTRNSFWTEKIKNNIERDIVVNGTLDKLGWTVLRVWESDIRRRSTQRNTLEKIRTFLVSVE